MYLFCIVFKVQSQVLVCSSSIVIMVAKKKGPGGCQPAHATPLCMHQEGCGAELFESWSGVLGVHWHVTGPSAAARRDLRGTPQPQPFETIFMGGANSDVAGV